MTYIYIIIIINIILYFIYIHIWLYMHLILHSHVCNPAITCKFHKFSSLWLDQIPFAPAHQNDWWSMMEPRLFRCHASLPGSYVKGSLKWHTSPTSAASGQPFCYDKKSWWVPSDLVGHWVGLCQETGPVHPSCSDGIQRMERFVPFGSIWLLAVLQPAPELHKSKRPPGLNKT